MPNDSATSFPLQLRKITIRNFRKLERLDVDVPLGKRVLCLVGPNGSGKSSFISLIAHSLSSFTQESAPDFNRGTGKPSDEEFVRNVSSGEITSPHDACLVLTEWSLGQNKYTYVMAIRYMDSQLDVSHLFSEQLRGIPVGFVLNQIASSEWFPPPQSQSDPFPGAVLLLRPADRFELPSYEEPASLVARAQIAKHWAGTRALPIRVRSWGVALEQFLFHMVMESLHKLPAAVEAMRLWRFAYEKLTGKSDQGTHKFSFWPFARFGTAELRQMSLLSAGELDIMVTVGLILAQAKAGSSKLGRMDLVIEGYVIIDEADAHLHPQWQAKAMAVLTETFPRLNFIITTHSPFVLRSLDPKTSVVVRLPDGEVFDNDFGAWQLDDILDAVFHVPATWAPGVRQQLKRLEDLASDEQQAEEAERIYRDLVGRGSNGLLFECKKIVSVYGTATLIERLAGTSAAYAFGQNERP